MNYLIFIFGVAVISMLLAGIILAYQKERDAKKEWQQKKESRNEYRTNEEFIAKHQQ